VKGAGSIIAALLLGISSAAIADDQQICADRPSKSTGACTVPAGRWQIETGLIDWTHDHSDGVTSDFTILGSSLIKLGISDRADVEFGFTPLEIARARTGAGHDHEAGFGDMLVRAKYHLTREGAPIEAAVDPFVKIPTASHDFGNGKVEGGLVVPTDAQLGKSGLTVSLDPELDLLADEDGHGHHLAMIQVLNLGGSLSDRVGLSAELWGMWDWDPAGTGKQVSADGAITYLLGKNLQLDAGANFGLNSETPDLEVYSGVSIRF
jgi:hypothetical protein